LRLKIEIYTWGLSRAHVALFSFQEIFTVLLNFGKNKRGSAYNSDCAQKSMKKPQSFDGRREKLKKLGLKTT